MNNELKSVYNDSEIQKINVTSLYELDNNYIHIIGNKEFISVVTNDTFQLNINTNTKVKK